MSESWNVLPSPSDDVAFVEHGPGVLACTWCGALVAERFSGRHREWHDAAGTGTSIQPRAVVVHGVQSPQPGSGQPYRVVEVVSSSSQPEALETLRVWVAGQRADLGIPDARGFRATFLPGWLPGAQSLPVRWAVDVAPDGRGARVTVLLIAAMELFGDARARSAATLYEERFDGLESVIRALLERR